MQRIEHIAIVKSSNQVTDLDVLRMSAACALQVKRDLAPAWGLLPISVGYYPSGVLPHGAWVIELVDGIPEAPGALGYHTEEGDVISGKIGLDPIFQNGGVALYDPSNPTFPTVSSVLSHEVCETIIDCYVNDWCDGPTIAQGFSYVKESADPVESDSYQITLKDGTMVNVSDFVLPAYFDAQAPQGGYPFDFLNRLTAPFSLAPGGYMVVRDASGNAQQVFGEVLPPAWRLNMKKHAWSRTAARLGMPDAVGRLQHVQSLRARA